MLLSSIHGTFVSENFRSPSSISGTFVLGNFHPFGTFVPGNCWNWHEISLRFATVNDGGF